MDLQHDSTANEGTGLGSGDESDSESETSTGPRLEPRRPHCAETPIQDAAADTMDDDSVQADRGPTHGMLGLAESQLERRPFVVAYPSRVQDLAGARNRAQRAHANASYELEITKDRTNPYAPFPSQLDWDIAKWAKLRGPGSTSFGELMSIPSVRTSLSQFSQI